MVSMQQRLEDIAAQIEREILTTGTITVGGKASFKNSLRSNPYAGLCHRAVLKVKELAPGCDVYLLSFELGPAGGNLFDRGRHVVALVPDVRGEYIVDPTIRQYLPAAEAVYAPNERYPLSMGGKVLRRKL